jgi:hypothetical protein
VCCSHNANGVVTALCDAMKRLLRVRAFLRGQDKRLRGGNDDGGGGGESGVGVRKAEVGRPVEIKWLLRWCYNNVKVVLQWCHAKDDGVTVVFNCCNNSVTKVSKRCHNSLTRV